MEFNQVCDEGTQTEITSGLVGCSGARSAGVHVASAWPVSDRKLDVAPSQLGHNFRSQARFQVLRPARSAAIARYVTLSENTRK